MSYDLMVFDPAVAPRDRAAFMGWYKEVTTWQNPVAEAGLTGNLSACYQALKAEFPPMNGPDAVDLDVAPVKPTLFQRLLGTAPPPPPQIDEAMLTDYVFEPSAIYMAFAWSVSDRAYNRVINAALSHDVGFFNVSANSGEILHDANQFDDFMGL